MPTTPNFLYHPGTGELLYPTTHTIAPPPTDMYYTWYTTKAKTHRITAIHTLTYTNPRVLWPSHLWETACGKHLGYMKEATPDYLTPGPVTCQRCLRKEPQQ